MQKFSQPWGGPECGKVKEKCVFVRALKKLREDQDRGEPGSLGPVKRFQGQDFFKSFEKIDVTSSSVIFGPSILRGFGEYVVFGDIHGDILALLGALFLAGVIGEDARWKPRRDPKSPSRCVVQLGDMLDRGGRGSASHDSSGSSREELNALEYMFALDLEARSFGERVLCVSGNHELFAIMTAFDSKLDKVWNFTTKTTACPFPNEGVSRNAIFRTPGALRYFAIHRPPLAISSIGWLFAHGDLPVKDLREFVEVTHPVLIGQIRRKTRLDFASCVVAACNLLWAAYVIGLGGDSSLWEALGPALRGSSETGKKLSKFPLSVCTCRSLASLKTDGSCDCDSEVEVIGRILGIDWALFGGVALGHTVQARVSERCAGRVQLLDIGMSEAFRGFNAEGSIAVLLISVSQNMRVTHA